MGKYRMNRAPPPKEGNAPRTHGDMLRFYRRHRHLMSRLCRSATSSSLWGGARLKRGRAMSPEVPTRLQALSTVGVTLVGGSLCSTLPLTFRMRILGTTHHAFGACCRCAVSRLRPGLAPLGVGPGRVAHHPRWMAGMVRRALWAAPAAFRGHRHEGRPPKAGLIRGVRHVVMSRARTGVSKKKVDSNRNVACSTHSGPELAQRVPRLSAVSTEFD